MTRRLSAKQWSDHISHHAASKQPLAAYCRQHGLAIATFRHWRKKLKAEPALAKPPAKPPTLVPVKIVPSVTTPALEPALMVAVIQSLLVTCKQHGVDPHTYLVDVLQRVGMHPASAAYELSPREWKQKFAADPLRSDLDLKPSMTG